tara:strand:+ start:251 stop:454 length:204 start_codon:yes stop_codon:yes gene_type:complete
MATLIQELTRRGLTSTTAHARRLLHIGGVRVDGGIVRDNIEVSSDAKITLRKAKGCTDIHKAGNLRD